MKTRQSVLTTSALAAFGFLQFLFGLRVISGAWFARAVSARQCLQPTSHSATTGSR